jgi:photosystem II stability/assembly factor-like uncharacterized protein
MDPAPDGHILESPLTSASRISIVKPNIPWGGRAVTATIDPTNASVAIVAAETGGLFATRDGGATWAHIDSFPQFRMSDAGISPRNHNLVVASTVFDMHVADQGGVWVSHDGGTTWTRPPGANPSSGSCARANSRGVAFAPDRDDIFVGNDCGLAVSHDAGTTWAQVPMGGSVVAVTAQSGGFVDVYGTLAGGIVHRRSTDGGATFSAGTNAISAPVPTGVHALAASPLSSSVLFAAGWVNQSAIYETSDGGLTWQALSAPAQSNRPPFVAAVRSRDGNPADVDLYYGNGIELLRQTCTGALCPGTWQSLSVDHTDPSGVAFPAGGSCPGLLVTDGGIHRTADCGTTWTITGSGAGGYNALQMNDVAIQVHPDHSDLYFGTQDNGVWASGDNGATWPFQGGNEGGSFQLAHDTPNGNGVTVTYSLSFGIFKSGALFNSSGFWNNAPGAFAELPFLVSPGVYGQFSGPDLLHMQLFLSRDVGATWTAVPGSTFAGVPTNLPRVSGPASAPTVYLGYARLPTGFGLLKITGILSSSATVVDVANHGIVELGLSVDLGVWPVFAVDPNDPSYLIVADAGAGQMKVSKDGGATYTQDTTLTSLVTAHGSLLFKGANDQCQARFIAFSPVDSSKIVVGTETAGIIGSTTGGASWFGLSGSSPVTPPVAAAFDELRGAIYVSTMGRGLWRIDDPVLLPVADAYVRDGTFQNTNFGSATSLQVKSSSTGYRRDAYLRFDISELLSVSSATFQWTANSSDGTPITVSAYPVSDTTWSEQSITWNNKPSRGNTAVASVTIKGTALASYTMDLSSYVKSQKSSGAKLISIALHVPATASALASGPSREASSGRPTLVVTP